MISFVNIPKLWKGPMNIRWVVLSDLHLGEEDSLLWSHLPAGKMVLEGLADALEEALRAFQVRPDLVLLGDTMEFALARPEDSISAFESFASFLVKERGIFGRIFYIPGNHDHRIWEMARQEQYLGYINRIGREALKERPWHRTRALATKDYHVVRPFVFDPLRQRGVEEPVMYPNMLLLDEERKRLLALHHGHLLETIYLLLSQLKAYLFTTGVPNTVEELERENHTWIDFLFSSFGYTGDVGERVELFYEMLQSEEALKKLGYNLATALSSHLRPLNRLPNRFKRCLLQALVNILVRHGLTPERKKEKVVMTNNLRKNIQWYISGPLLNQIKEDAKIEVKTPYSFDFIFGHTHKPFFQELSLPCFKGNVRVFNTGGFMVDQFVPKGPYGTGILFISDGLDPVHVVKRCVSKDMELLCPKGTSLETWQGNFWIKGPGRGSPGLWICNGKG